MYRATYGLCHSREATEDLVQDDQAVAFVDRITPHLAHWLRHALQREQTSAGLADREPDALVLDADGAVCSLTDQARHWLKQSPIDRGTGLELPTGVHCVARNAARSDGTSAAPCASVRLTCGELLIVQGAALQPATARRATHGCGLR
jgi:hypothetical protein